VLKLKERTAPARAKQKEHDEGGDGGEKQS